MGLATPNEIVNISTEVCVKRPGRQHSDAMISDRALHGHLDIETSLKFNVKKSTEIILRPLATGSVSESRVRASLAIVPYRKAHLCRERAGCGGSISRLPSKASENR